MIRFAIFSLCLAMALTPPSTVAAQGSQSLPWQDAPDDWCKLDAPGLYRQLRAEARAKGEREVGACPLGGASAELPKRLVIPLPCGRALEMRRIDVPASGFLDHIAEDFGGAPEGSGILTLYAQGNRRDVIAGTFSRKLEENGGGAAIGYRDLGYRSYYVASHEWMELHQGLIDDGVLALWADPDRTPAQEDAKGLCANVNTKAADLRFSDVLPQGNVSWYDAQTILAQLNGYIMAESRRRIDAGLEPLVPWEQGSSGFFRLPSEVEWEYAAFGGAPGAVDRSATHLVRGPDNAVKASALTEVAVISDGRNSGHIRGVGSLSPNLAGLYDTIGNAAEMTHDLFSIVRPDTRHGGRGGIVLRGGNALTPSSVLGIGHRQELPLHTFEGPGRAAFGGLRLMLAAPILPRGHDPEGKRAPDLQNNDLPNRLEDEHKRLTAIRETPGANFRLEAQRLLSALQENADSGGSLDTGQVSAVRRALEQSEAALNAAQEAELAARIRSAADAIFAMRSLSAIAITWHEKLDEAAELVRTEFPEDQRPAAEARVREARQRIFIRTQIIDVQVRDLARIINAIAGSEEKMVARLSENEANRLRTSGIALYDDFLIWDKLASAISRLKTRPNEDHFVWLRTEFDVFREDRISSWGER